MPMTHQDMVGMVYTTSTSQQTTRMGGKHKHTMIHRGEGQQTGCTRYAIFSLFFLLILLTPNLCRYHNITRRVFSPLIISYTYFTDVRDGWHGKGRQGVQCTLPFSFFLKIFYSFF